MSSLAQIVDALIGQPAWASQRCRQCGSCHLPGSCPSMRGLQIHVEHLPGYGWRGCVCLPTGLGDMLVRQEIPSGSLQQLAKGQAAQVQGGEVGFLPLILAALSTPQGQQAMKQLASAAGQGLEAYAGQGQGAQQQPMAQPPPTAAGPSRKPFFRGGTKAFFTSMAADQLQQYGGNATPVSATADAPDPQPDVQHVVAGIPTDIGPLPESTHAWGEKADEHAWFGELPEDTYSRMRQLPVPDPHALIQTAPAILGASATLARAKYLADSWPEFEALSEVLGLAERIVDIEAARLLGDSDAAEGLRNAIHSRNKRVQAALKIARTMLG